MSAGAVVALEGVAKDFATDAGTVHALDAISLEVAAGTSLAVTGPSGCGKSTLLSLIGALEPPSRGSVRLGEQLVGGLTADGRARLRRLEIGFVFQSDNLQPFLTAEENVALALSLAGCDTAGPQALDLLAALGLAEAAERLPDALSGGERQRVAVARALVHRPRLILADEPTGSLDGRSATAVIDLLCDEQAATGATLIVITHDAAVAERLDRRLALRDGRIDDGDDAAPAATGSATRA